MLDKECKRLGYETKDFASPEKLKSVAEKLNMPDVDNMMAALGYGGLTLNTILAKLVDLT